MGAGGEGGGDGRGQGRVLGFRSCSCPGEGAMLSGESQHRAPELWEESGWLGGELRAPAVVSFCGFLFKLPLRQYDLSPDLSFQPTALGASPGAAAGDAALELQHSPGDKAGMGLI